MSLNYLPLPVYVSFCLFLSIVLISFLFTLFRNWNTCSKSKNS